MKISHHVKILTEVREAVDWYEAQSPGLGAAFFAALEQDIDLMAKRPRFFGFWLSSKRLRRIRMKKFPYDILFWILPGRIRIVCVRHEKRHPSYGMHRK